MHSSVAYISDSVELRAVMVCLPACQSRGPPAKVKIYPEIERTVNGRTSSVGFVGSGTVWSCDPQLASQKASTKDLSRGKLMKASIGVWGLVVVNEMPRSREDFR